MTNEIIRCDETIEHYYKLLERGKNIFREIGGEINVISNKHVERGKMEWRRESDFNEMCIALAILEERLASD